MKEQTIYEYKKEHRLKDDETAQRFGLKVRALGNHKDDNTLIFSDDDKALLVPQKYIYTIKLSDKGADDMLDKLENPPEPTEFLKDAHEAYKQAIEVVK